MSLDTPAPSVTSRRTGGSDFAELRRRVDDAGLLARRPRYYAIRFAAVAVALVATWTTFVVVGNSWWQLLVAVGLAVVFAQLALLAHDIAHRQVFRTRRPSEIAGRLVGNLGVGMSYGWWMDKHARHHANPNHEELDPDIAPTVLVWSQEQARDARPLAQFVAKYEAWLFFPLLCLEAFNLHWSSAQAVLDPKLKRRRLEGGLLLVHAVAYLGLVLAALPPGKAIAFIFVQQALFGLYLGCSFAPSHKGMPTLRGGTEPDFLRKQVLTSRNVRGSVVKDVALGGLNYQIEHHLFPSMPCPNLRAAQPIVKAFCAERDVEYAEAGLVESYRIALHHMNSVGAELRAASRAPAA
jgi:fatty acid desaturase